MKPQPVPNVADADVRRIALRDYPTDQQARIAEILSRYGRESWQVGKHRVQLAILKLASGDVSSLEVHVQRACQDYRDVLAAAEYPQYSARAFSRALASGEEAKVIEADWHQYNEWLRR